MTLRDVGPPIGSELRGILHETDAIRHKLKTEYVEEREWLDRALARIETASRRVIHLVGA